MRAWDAGMGASMGRGHRMRAWTRAWARTWVRTWVFLLWHRHWQCGQGCWNAQWRTWITWQMWTHFRTHLLRDFCCLTVSLIFPSDRNTIQVRNFRISLPNRMQFALINDVKSRLMTLELWQVLSYNLYNLQAWNYYYIQMIYWIFLNLKKVLLRYISSYNKGGFFFEIRSPDSTSIFDQWSMRTNQKPVSNTIGYWCISIMYSYSNAPGFKCLVHFKIWFLVFVTTMSVLCFTSLTDGISEFL